MLTKEDIERGYPSDKQETALFLMALALIMALLIAFLTGSFLKDLGIHVARLLKI
jgi:hypothetical protein